MMTDSIGMLKQALQDPKIEDLSCICPVNYPLLKNILRGLTHDCYISEWQYGMGMIHYEYHIHRGEKGARLQEERQKGIKGGHPTLTVVYSKKELETIIQKAEKEAES